jgi:hypothetical protein
VSMYLKSLYPEPPPNPPHLNAYLALLGRPDQGSWPDFIGHVEHHTGKSYSFIEVCKRINNLATALGSPTSLGGLGLQSGNGEIIGIMSDNSSVSKQHDFWGVLSNFRRITSLLQYLASRLPSLLFSFLAILHLSSFDMPFLYPKQLDSSWPLSTYPMFSL